MKQAEACAKEGQLPIAVFHQDGKKYREALVVVRLSELANLVKGER
jgi:hypothetical protein